MFVITSLSWKMTRLIDFYKNVQDACGSEPEFEYTDPDRQKPYLQTHDLFFRMQRVCLVLGRPFLQGHVKILPLPALVPVKARPQFSSTVEAILTLTGVLCTS